MTLNAPTASSDAYQDLVNAIFTEDIPEAIKILSTFKDTARVDNLVKVLECKHYPEIWLAAFQNPMLYEEMDSRHLHILIPHLTVMRAKQFINRELFNNCNDIFQIIVSHRAWCRMLSYSYFIPLTAANADLARCIGNDPIFIRMLEPIHLLKLISYYPKGAKDIFKAIEQFLDKEYLDDLWAKETIRYLLQNSQFARKAIVTEMELASLKQIFCLEFSILIEQPSNTGCSSTTTSESTESKDPIKKLEDSSLTLDDELVENVADEGFNRRYYSDKSMLVNFLSGRLDQLQLADDPEEAEDEELQNKPTGLRRTKSFYLKN